MKPGPHILVADRNRHIRSFLRRELIQEGWLVLEARCEPEVVNRLMINPEIELVILDPDLPHANGPHVLEGMDAKGLHPAVIIHAFDTEELKIPPTACQVRIVEKRGNNLSRLKAAVAELLKG